MSSQPSRRLLRRIGLVLSIVLTPLLLITAVLIGFHSPALASSHREAPIISKDTFADNTDTYVFISPENQNNIVFVGSWIPFEAPEGGPNYYEWDDSALYDIYVDNDGDAKADITYTLSSKVKVENQATFLYNTNTIKSLTDPNWNRKQYITVTETIEGNPTPITLVANKLTAPVNIGSKSTPNYQALADAAIQTISTPQGAGKVYAGQTDDAFWVDLQVFDLLTLRGQKPPVGYTNGTNIPVDSLSSFNVHSFVVEVPISHVTAGSDTVVGMWAGTRRATTRVIQALGTQAHSGNEVQVSRLGMPLVNEVVIPLALKDAFNSVPPSTDLALYTGVAGPEIQALLQKSVENPELGTLLCSLYGVPLPAAIDATSSDLAKKCNTAVTTGVPRSGRGDIFDIFLTGMKLAAPFTINTKTGPMTLPAGFNVNQMKTVTPSEMIRINTAIKGDLCSPTPSRLGVLGGDACGFPNGRRLTDDVVEIELLAVAGAAYPVLDGRDTSFAFTPALIGVLTDGIDHNDVPFRGATAAGEAPKQFPYMGTAQSGQEHWHTNPFFNILLTWISKN
ncbi:MAG: DUF4331 domain-containing protein [Chloroflexi bacterium]|nr:DUF4331 domain-containing protein [Chloroflexota bacterium]